MCPLRLILIFLSATLAGFFVVRNLKSQPQTNDEDDDPPTETNDAPKTSLPAFSKIRTAVESGFWTCVDMATGRYLWKHLVSSDSKRST